ncbi:MAG: class I SAM-dependent methyltransferase [Sedimentisphaerales bacterium]|nr:class I SAM-dependent methyltransferase [Sedimentisphaerales bacterium]
MIEEVRVIVMDDRFEEYEKAVSGTKEFYDRFAPYYDEFVPPKEMRTDRIDSLVACIKEKARCSNDKLHILELGCGTGSYAIPLAQSGHSVIGIDISSEMRYLAVKKLGGQLPADFKYLTSDWLSAFETWENEFDCILCIGNSLIHNPPSILPNLFTAAFRALRAGGILILNGRRIERELDMVEGMDITQNDICRSSGPARAFGIEPRIALRFMFMTKIGLIQENKTVIAFYTYDNYEEDGRRFVCHRMLFDNLQTVETKPVEYDTWATKTYFIFKNQLIKVLKECGFSGVREESPDREHFKLEKNWYVVAQRPIN